MRPGVAILKWVLEVRGIIRGTFEREPYATTFNYCLRKVDAGNTVVICNEGDNLISVNIKGREKQDARDATVPLKKVPDFKIMK